MNLNSKEKLSDMKEKSSDTFIMKTQPTRLGTLNTNMSNMRNTSWNTITMIMLKRENTT